MPGEITFLWAQIAEWLRINAPATFARLKPPADERALADLASELGAELPPDLGELLQCFNGCDSRNIVGLILFPRGHYAMDTSEISSSTRLSASIWEDNWEPTWIKVGNDLCGGGLVLDVQRQPPYGRIFEFDKVDGPFGSGWKSLKDLLTEMLALLQGRPIYLAHRNPDDYPRAPDPLKAVVRDGELEWESGIGDWIMKPR